jgi:hypothetical protein
MGLINDDCEPPSSVFCADLVEDERKLLHRGDDDLFAAFDELAELLRALSDGADRRADLGKLLDCVSNLLVENTTIRDDNDGIEDRPVVLLKSDKLVREPGD